MQFSYFPLLKGRWLSCITTKRKPQEKRAISCTDAVIFLTHLRMMDSTEQFSVSFFFFLTLEFRKLSDATTSLAYWFFSPCILMRFVHSTWTLTAYTRGRCTDDWEKNIYRLTDHQLLCSMHQGVCLLLAGKFFGALRSKSESHCKKLFTYILPNSSIFTLHVELLTKTYFTV